MTTLRSSTRLRTDAATLPRDPSALGRRPRPEASASARKPLGLAIVDGPETDERASSSIRRDIAGHVDSLVGEAIKSLGGEERTPLTRP